MFRFFFIFIFINLSVAANFNNSKNQPKQIELDQLLADKSFVYTQKEKIIASHIESILKLTSLNFLNTHTLNITKNEILKSSTFKPFKNWILNLSQIHTETNLSKLIDICNNSKSLESQLLKSDATEYCLNHFLTLFSQHSKMNKVTTTHLNYLVDNFPYYLSKNLSLLVTFLKSISTNERIYDFVSENITNYIIQNGIIPDSYLTQNISITPSLTKYIQLRGFDKHSTENIFFNELAELTNKFYDKYETDTEQSLLIKELKEILNFTELNFSHLPKTKSLEKISLVAKYLIRRGYFEESRFTLSFIKKYNNHYYNQVANFYQLWTYILEEKFDKGISLIRSENLLNNITSHDDRMLFWMAYCLNKTQNFKELDSVISALMRNSPIGYYTIMANSLNPQHNHFTKIISEENKKYSSANYLPEEMINSIKRIRIFNDLNSQIFIDNEIDQLSNLDFSNKHNLDINTLKNDYVIITSKFIAKNNNHLFAFKNIYKSIEQDFFKFSRDLLSVLFPANYLNILAKQNTQIDPLIILSLIRQESGFNPRATSRVGAKGLMQLMPNTAKMMGGSRKVSMLTNPEININLGTKYLGYLMKKYENNLVYSLSAYNAGENRVKRWQDKFFKNQNFLHIVESIPFNETKAYVQLIFRNYYFYKLLENKIDDKISKSPETLFEVTMN